MRIFILVFAWLLTVISGCENKSAKTERSDFTQTNPQLESRDQTVTEHDLLILQRAKKILSDESVWDRQDDRNCDKMTTHGVYFVLYGSPQWRLLENTIIEELLCRKSALR